MSSSSGGVESSQSAERSRQAFDGQASSDKKSLELQQNLETLLESSFSQERTPGHSIADAIQKLELLQQTQGADQHDVISRVIESLQKSSPDQLVTVQHRLAWLSSVINPQGHDTIVSQAQAQAATSFKPKENPFAARPIAQSSSSDLNFSQHSDTPSQPSDSDSDAGTIRTLKKWFNSLFPPTKK